jgi:hypothetical protein
VGVLAIRKGSLPLALATGLVFAAALLTKFYAAFTLIPLILFYIYSRPKQPKLILTQLAAFAVPTLAAAFLWYQIFLGRSLLAMFQHNDFNDIIPASTHVVASPFFATNFLLNYGVGPAVLVAAGFSLLLGLVFRKVFSKTAFVDLTCLVTIVVILGVNTYLGAGLSLNVPYFSALKYDYQALPFLVLLAASLTAKSLTLFKAAKSGGNAQKLPFYAVASVAVILLSASLVWTMYTTNLFSTYGYLQFRVEPNVDYGYALLTSTPVSMDGSLMGFQFWGFCMVLFGMLLAAKNSILQLAKPKRVRC